MKRCVLVLTIIAMSSMNLVGQSEGEGVILATQTGNIHGTLLVPGNVDKPEIVLIIAGSGPTDRNGNFPMGTNNSLKLLAEGLYTNGIASLRYDKRGIGESAAAGKSEIEMRFDPYVDDVIAWAEMLKNDSRFGDLTVLGHSEGSLIGMIAAQKVKVAKFISLAGSGIPAGDLIRNQLKEQPPTVLEQAVPILEALEAGDTLEEIPQMLFPLFRPSVQPYMISWFAHNPQEEIAQLTCPILIVQGTTDIQIDASHADKLHTANTKAKKVIIEGMNHILKPSGENRMENLATYSNPDIPLQEGLLEALVTFIREN